jgi:hydroxymethylglutaryl-CoA lyase
MAPTNIYVSLEEGITTFDSSAGGLGGCPYAKGATGNVATEDLWYLLHSEGLETGVDIQKLSEASKFILEKLNRSSESKFLRAYLNTGKV